MKLILKYWYLAVILMTALVIDSHLVQWALAVIVGGYSLGAGFEDAFEHFTLVGYLLLTAFRIVPFFGLGIILFALSKGGKKHYVLPVFIGGFLAVFGTTVWGYWETQHAYYTDEHVSSTTALGFLFTSYYACVIGAFGIGISFGLYALYRKLSQRLNPLPS